MSDTSREITQPKLYQFAAVWYPTEKQHEAGERAKLIIEPATILAANDQAAILLAGRQLPEQYAEQLDQVQVLVRPF